MFFKLDDRMCSQCEKVLFLRTSGAYFYSCYLCLSLTFKENVVNDNHHGVLIKTLD